MKEIKLELDFSKKYVIGCSFGPDSMALLDAAIKNKLSIVVAHVNYRKRKVSINEQRALEAYCKERNIPFYVLDLLNVKSEGNFQEWAREKRYLFFKEVLRKESADAVLIAHQEDDVIETYLMQKKRGNFVKSWGISREIELFGEKILRPLLNYSKSFLKEYDEENNVPFSIDESNLTDHYTRNKFRHHVVEKLSEEERKNILAEIKKHKEPQAEIKTTYSKEEFLNQSYESTVSILDYFMNRLGEHRDLSQKYINEIKKAMKTKVTISFSISKSLILEKDYNEIILLNGNKIKGYEANIDGSFKNEFLDIDFTNGAEDRGIDSIDGIKVTNCKKNDKIIIKDYECKVNRLFIDWKMPLYLREIWPKICDKNDKILYIPRYRKIYTENHKSKLKIDTEYFKNFD